MEGSDGGCSCYCWSGVSIGFSSFCAVAVARPFDGEWDDLAGFQNFMPKLLEGFDIDILKVSV